MRTRRKNNQTAENAGDQVVICFGFASDWLREWREFPDQSHSEVRQNKCNLVFAFDTRLEIAVSNLPLKVHLNNDN